MEKWEYLTFIAQGDELEAKLPQLGVQGWEMVGMVQAGFSWEHYSGSGPMIYIDKWGANGYRVVFKRRKA